MITKINQQNKKTTKTLEKTDLPSWRPKHPSLKSDCIDQHQLFSQNTSQPQPQPQHNFAQQQQQEKNINDLLQLTQCLICQKDVSNNPVQCPECHKIYGYNCIKQYQILNQEPDLYCPHCKSLWLKDIEQLQNRFIRDVVKIQFQVHCFFQQNGCQQIIQCEQEELDNHYQICQFQEVICYQNSSVCGWEGQLKNLEEHQLNECPYLLIECQECENNKENISSFFKKENHQKYCKYNNTQCPQCEQFIPNNQYQQHAEILCEKKQFICKKCENLFFKNDFLQHQNSNCEKSQNLDNSKTKNINKQNINPEIKLLKLENQDLKQQLFQYKQQIQTQINKQKYISQISLKLQDLEIDRKEQILQDINKGIFHINSLQQLNQIYELGLEINSVIINEYDFNRYTYSKTAKTNFKPIIEIMQKLAQKGDSWTQFSLGLLYYCGDKDIEMNDKTAYYWANKSMQQKNPGGQCLFGLFYFFGYYIDQDYEKAVEHFENSCKQMFPPAFYYLADCIYNGKGTEQDKKKGLQYYQMSAQQGYPYALRVLGDKLQNYEIYSDEPEKESYECYLKAARKFEIQAMENVYQNLNTGIGVQQNQIQANIWKEKIKKLKYEEQFQAKQD
ncbi:TRAF-like protein [Pseudocohnilembus persalinus]|uniref:TRAF-like protein n=1 Tax=Pseudocohnilembus persalinus TaxID=266149 RepID=A0A0V0QAR4_PSEPJ|nr:TRAF-like protein [Pseudocohnilembus persalinus]|eukprot:KRW99301.1 TRAF-like protein [Pseudocohnilembus persalinus]